MHIGNVHLCHCTLSYSQDSFLAPSRTVNNRFLIWQLLWCGDLLCPLCQYVWILMLGTPQSWQFKRNALMLLWLIDLQWRWCCFKNSCWKLKPLILAIYSFCTILRDVNFNFTMYGKKIWFRKRWIWFQGHQQGWFWREKKRLVYFSIKDSQLKEDIGSLQILNHLICKIMNVNIKLRFNIKLQFKPLM